MLRTAVFFVALLNAPRFGLSIIGEYHETTLSDKNLSKQLVNSLVHDVINVDERTSAFCRIDEDVVIKKYYGNDSYVLSFTLPLESSEQIRVETRHRVIYIKARNYSKKVKYEYVSALSNLLDVKGLTSTFKDGILFITIPYKGKFGVIANASCSEDIDGRINYIYDANEISNTESETRDTVSQAGASSGVVVGNGAITEGEAGAYSKTAAGTGVGNSGAMTDASAVADARSKAVAATNANTATLSTGSDSNAKAASVSKGGSYEGMAGSLAHSASLAGAESNGNGTLSASGSSGLAGAYNVGGEKGLGGSSTLVSSGSVSKGPDGVALSSSTSATNSYNFFGKTNTATVTTATAISKNGSSLTVTITPKNNVTRSIIDLKL